MPTRIKILLSDAQKYTFIFISVGLLIALGMYYSMLGKPSSNWMFSSSILVAILFLYVSGYFISRYMDHLINQKKLNELVVGITGSFIILIFGILAGSSINALTDSYPTNSLIKVLLDYYYTPLLIILMVGGIPTMILGSILGKMIKNDSM